MSLPMNWTNAEAHSTVIEPKREHRPRGTSTCRSPNRVAWEGQNGRCARGATLTSRDLRDRPRDCAILRPRLQRAQHSDREEHRGDVGDGGGRAEQADEPLGIEHLASRGRRGEHYDESAEENAANASERALIEGLVQVCDRENGRDHHTHCAERRDDRRARKAERREIADLARELARRGKC